MSLLIKRLEVMTPDAYVRESTGGATRCPSCRSPALEGQAATSCDDITVVMSVECLECFARWDEEYTLIGYDNLTLRDEEESI